MRGGGGKDGLRLAEAVVNLFEARKKAGQGAGAYGDMRAHLDITAPQRSRFDAHALLRMWVLDKEQVFGQQFAEAPVDFTDGFRADGASVCPAPVDPLLDSNMVFVWRFCRRRV